MASIHPDYEYDIFISYRHNDDHSGGVSEFVELLKEELAVTIKESLTVYFDSNAHDGLLENHSVDKSLEGKLKCLIFIPIISQTYCDSQSYAWNHELLPFLEMAKKEELGMDIKLDNGNVASRVLPVKIHELDEQDKTLLENKLGDVLRGIEFIYKEPGVNRPLKVEDSKSENLNHTDYSNQVNKVANAIKEIIAAIKSPTSTQMSSSLKGAKNSQVNAGNQGSKRKLLYLVSIVVVLILVYFWFKFNIQEKPVQIVEVDKSLVVLPFQDMSANQDQEWFSDGLAEELLNRLSKVSELKLISRTTAFAFKGKGLTAKAIADSLGVTYVLEGSVRKANDQLRITAQLIKADDETHIWSNTYDYGMDSIFAVQEDISENITKALNILLDEEARAKMFLSGTKNIEAYEEYLKGNGIYSRAHLEGDYNYLSEANSHYEKAISIDPEFAAAYYKHQDIYAHNIIGGEYIESLQGLSNEEKYDLMIRDMDASIAYIKSDDEKLSYQFDKNFLSKDWKDLRLKISALKENNLSAGWLPAILDITDPGYIYQHHSEVLKLDPLNELELYFTSIALIQMNQLDSAWILLDTYKGRGFTSKLAKSFILIGKKEYIMALEFVSGTDFKDSYHYILIQLLAGKYDKNYGQFKERIDSLGVRVNTYGDSPIQIYNALGAYNKADSLASIIDAKFLGHCSLAINVASHGLNFHLDATPNFSARLSELGIDLEEFEQEHYYQYPVVHLE